MSVAVSGDPRRVPHFVSAPTAGRLVQAMFKNNLEHGCEFQYFDIGKQGKAWVAWYYLKIDRDSLNEALRKGLK